MPDLVSVAATTSPCKVCGTAAPLFGVCDFNRSCEEGRSGPLPLTGIPIYYHRCPQCGFLFTTAFDAFSHDDFSRWIYNDQYAAVDPDYLAVRPGNNTMLVADFIGPALNTRVLDYGSGNGLLARNLRQRGFTDVVEYDPFVPASSHRPQGRFECITAFEVLEHSVDPRRTVQDMASLLADPGIILFSTSLQPERIVATGMNWWYIGPRNGHASVFSLRSLQLLSASAELGCGSFSNIMHVMLRHVPQFAATRIRLAQ